MNISCLFYMCFYFAGSQLSWALKFSQRAFFSSYI